MDLETGTIREVGFLQTSTKFVASRITHQKNVLVCSRNSTANVCSAFDVERAMCHQQQENKTFMTSKNVSQQTIHSNEVSHRVGEPGPADLCGGGGQNPRQKKKSGILFMRAETAGCVRRFLFDDREFSHTDRREKIERSGAALSSRFLLSLQGSWNPQSLT